MKALKISSVILLLTAQQVLAQEAMTLKQCVEYAVENSASAQISEESLSQTKTYKRDAWLEALTPHVYASTSLQFSTGRQEDIETNMYKDYRAMQNNYSINGEIYLFNGLEGVNKIIKAKNNNLSQQEGLKAKQDEIALNTTQYYYNYLYYTKLSNITKKQAEDAENTLRKTRREFELGSKSEQDVLEKESAQSEALLTYVKYNAAKNKALLQLKSAMYYPQNDTLIIDTTIVESVNIISANDVAQTAAYAADNNSASLMKRYEMQNKIKDLHTQRWKFLPTVSAFAGWSTAYGVDVDNRSSAASFHEQTKSRASKWIGVTARIDLYNRLGKFSNVSRAKSEYKIATYEYEIKQREIEDQVYGAYDEAQQAEIQLNASRKAANLNQKYFDLAKRRFELGLTNYIEYDQAYNKFLESQANYYNALFDYKIKSAIIKYYKGESYLEQL